MLMSSGKPLLPSISSLLCTGDIGVTKSAPVSPLIASTSFNSDDRGIIRLPPLTILSRPRSVDSAVRCSTTISTTTATTAAATTASATVTPKTPSVKQKRTTAAATHHTKKNAMLTPLSAAKAIITPSAKDKKRAFAFITHSQETFPTKEPKIDNAPLARRKRRRTSTQELNILQAEFRNNPAPDKQKRAELAERCKMSEKAVQIWFQNKRQSVKKQKLAAERKAATLVTVDSETSSSSDSIIQSTPLSKKQSATNSQTDAPASNSTPHLAVPSKDNRHMTPPRSYRAHSSSPTHRRGQALTFHLKTADKILTPVKTSPNNRVNKLINGTGDNISPTRRKKHHTLDSSTPIKTNPKQDFKHTPLKEINPNTMAR